MDTNIILSNNPQEYGLPYTSWYPNQRELAEKAVNLKEKRVLIIEAPTGLGKSSIGVTVSHFRKGTVVLMSTRDLQQQYAQTFSNVAVIWGQGNYPCIDEVHIQTCKKIYGENPSRADCPFDSHAEAAQKCTLFHRCPYEVAKRRAMVAQTRVLNYHYGYFSSWWKQENNAVPWDLVCDEAHTLPEVLASLVSINIAPSTANFFGLPSVPVIEGGLRRDMNQAVNWLHNAQRSMSRAIKNKDVRKRKRAIQLYTKLTELQDVISSAERESWYIKSGDNGFSARPVIPGNYAQKIIIPNARSIILMSATIGRPEILLRELGLSNSEYEFVSTPHGFPKENRPIFWVTNVPKIRYKTTSSEYDYQAQVINKIINLHKNEKGLIHTASWKHANNLARALAQNGNADRIMLANGKRLSTIEKFKKAI